MSSIRKFPLYKYYLKFKNSTRQNSHYNVKTYCTIQKPSVSTDDNYLAKHLHDKIIIKGPITVADYMKDVLQNPAKGYYMSKDMLGESGDFITSPEISQIFGEMLAVWFLNEWSKFGAPKPLQIIELGPGRGTLSADILKVFEHFKALHQTTLQLVEISPTLSAIQGEKLCDYSFLTNQSKNAVYRQGITRHGIPVKWYKELDDVPDGFSLILAHEFFDALPIHKFHKTYAGYREVLIDVDKKNRTDEMKFRYVLARSETPMQKILIKANETREHVEISADSMILYQKICNRIVSHGGIVLICDYGHNGSGTDTFRAFKKHTQVDPLIQPGIADLTADVDFNLIRETALENKDVLFLGPVTQKEFLEKVGINHRIEALKAKITDQGQLDNLEKCYKFLMDEDKMGERFKFCTLIPSTVKKIINDYPVTGFT